MKSIICLLLAVAFGGAQEPSLQTQLPDERWALIIGISKYPPPIGELYGTEDAEAIYDDLTLFAQFKSDHIILLDDKQQSARSTCQTDTLEPYLSGSPTRDNIVDCIAWLARTVPSNGLIFVYFSGHGISIENNTFLMAKNTPNTADLDRLKERGIGAETLVEPMLRNAATRQFIFVIDACRGEGRDKVKGRDSADRLDPGFVEVLRSKLQNRGIKAFFTLFSTEPGDSSYSYTDQRMSAFTRVLHQAFLGQPGLKGRGSAYGSDGILTLRRLIDYLTENTPDLVFKTNDGKIQRPWSKLEGFNAERLALAVRLPVTDTRVRYVTVAVDLTDLANADYNWLLDSKTRPVGAVVLGGIKYQIKDGPRSIIATADVMTTDRPMSVVIPLNGRPYVHMVHMLLNGLWLQNAPTDVVGVVRLRYATGIDQEVPLVRNDTIREGWAYVNEPGRKPISAGSEPKNGITYTWRQVYEESQTRCDSSLPPKCSAAKGFFDELTIKANSARRLVAIEVVNRSQQSGIQLTALTLEVADPTDAQPTAVTDLPTLQITYPPTDYYTAVDLPTQVSIHYANLSTTLHPWLLVQGQEGPARYWPIGPCDKDGHSLIEPQPRITRDGDWVGNIQVGSPSKNDHGQEFTLLLVAVDNKEDERLAQVARGGSCPHTNEKPQDGTRIRLTNVLPPAPAERKLRRQP